VLEQITKSPKLSQSTQDTKSIFLEGLNRVIFEVGSWLLLVPTWGCILKLFTTVIDFVSQLESVCLCLVNREVPYNYAREDSSFNKFDRTIPCHVLRQ